MRAVLPVLVEDVATQVVKDIIIDLKPPAFLIKDIEFKVIVERCVVIRNKVLIVGHVIVNVQFKTHQGIGDDVFRAEVRVICGDVRHCTAIVPFTAAVEVPGAKPGDECRIICAEVEGEVVEVVEKKKHHLPEEVEEHHRHCDGHHRIRVLELIERIRVTFAILIQLQVVRQEEVVVTAAVRREFPQSFRFPSR